jgi:Ca-activated chloride channel family protein
MRWLYPFLLLLLLVMPVLVYWGWYRRRKHRHIGWPFSTLAHIDHKTDGLWVRLVRMPYYLQIMALFFVILALARPQALIDRWPVWDEGIDIAFVLDISPSMNASDLRPSRMIVAKRMLKQILELRRQRNDRFGLIIFAGAAYALCPLTVDHAMLGEMLQHVEAGQLGSGTAIGDAIATGLARLRHVSQRQRAIVLITDGENNAGRVQPFAAARLSHQMGIPIYAILIGRLLSGSSEAKSEQNLTQKGRGSKEQKLEASPSQTLLDPSTPWGALQRVSDLSKGMAYHIADLKTWDKQLTHLLDRMTPTRTQRPRYFAMYRDIYDYFLWAALMCFAISLLLQLTRLRTP